MSTIYDGIVGRGPVIEADPVHNLLQSCLELVKYTHELENFRKLVEKCSK